MSKSKPTRPSRRAKPAAALNMPADATKRATRPAKLPPHILVWTCTGVEYTERAGREPKRKFLCDGARGRWSFHDAPSPGDVHTCPHCGRPAKVWREAWTRFDLSDDEKAIIDLADRLGVTRVIVPLHRGGFRERLERQQARYEAAQTVLDAAAAADGLVTSKDGGCG